MEQRLSLITLAVSDLDRALAFYTAMGWTRTGTEEGIAAFDLLAQTLGLYRRAALAEELGLSEDEIGGFSGITLAHNVRRREDVAAVLDEAEAAGGRILKPAQDVFWGGHHGYFADPDGHVWEVAFNPFAPLGPDGAFQWGGVT